MGVRGVCVGMCMWHGVVCAGRVCPSVWRLEPGPHAPNLITHLTLTPGSVPALPCHLLRAAMGHAPPALPPRPQSMRSAHFRTFSDCASVVDSMPTWRRGPTGVDS